MNEDNKGKEEPAKFEWTPEAVENIIKLVDALAKQYVEHKDKEKQAENKYAEIITRHNKNLTMILGSIMVGIVVLMSYLTFLDKVSGDALLFLVGTITGYVILFIQQLIFEPVRPEPPPEIL